MNTYVVGNKMKIADTDSPSLLMNCYVVCKLLKPPNTDLSDMLFSDYFKSALDFIYAQVSQLG